MPTGFGYGPDAGKSKGPKMESDKQEKENLLSDNPVAKDASGGRPWISKHFRSSMGSPALSHHEKGSMAKKLDPMHNGEPGVQQEDFEQFSNPLKKEKEKRDQVPEKNKKPGKYMTPDGKAVHTLKEVHEPSHQRALKNKK